jgi:hypothetical protein
VNDTKVFKVYRKKSEPVINNNYVCNIRSKVVPVLKHHTMMIYGGELELHTFLTLALNRGEWLVSSSRRQPPISLDGKLNGSQARMDIVTKKKITAAAGNQTPSSSLSPVTNIAKI